MAQGDMPMCSSTHAQGIGELWARLAGGVRQLSERRELEAVEGEEGEEGGRDGAAEALAAGAPQHRVRRRRRRHAGEMGAEERRHSRRTEPP